MYTIKVTKINNNFHARLFKNSIIIKEMACSHKQDIGFICREMMRWEDKLNGGDKYTAFSRKNQTTNIGKYWSIKNNK